MQLSSSSYSSLYGTGYSYLPAFSNTHFQGKRFVTKQEGNTYVFSGSGNGISLNGKTRASQSTYLRFRIKPNSRLDIQGRLPGFLERVFANGKHKWLAKAVLIPGNLEYWDTEKKIPVSKEAYQVDSDYFSSANDPRLENEQFYPYRLLGQKDRVFILFLKGKTKKNPHYLEEEN